MFLLPVCSYNRYVLETVPTVQWKLPTTTLVWIRKICQIRKVEMYSKNTHLCTEIISVLDNSGLYRFHCGTLVI